MEKETTKTSSRIRETRLRGESQIIEGTSAAISAELVPKASRLLMVPKEGISP